MSGTVATSSPDLAARWTSREKALTVLAPAIRFREDGRHVEAVAWLRERVRATPDDAAAHALLAHSLWQLRADADASEAMRRALQLAPGSALVQRCLAKGLLRLGRVTDAIAAAERGFELDPTHPDAMLTLAMVADSVGRGPQALELLNRAADVWPDYAEIRGVRALVRKKAGQIADAIGDAESAVTLKPGLTAGWALLAQLRRQVGDLPGAINAFEKASTLDPSNLAHLVNLGDAMRTAERFGDARRILESAVALDPTSAAAWTNLGATLHSLAEGQAARQAYERAIGVDPAAAEALHNLGILVADDNDPESALAWFEKALAYRPQDPRFLASRAWALIELSRPDEEVRAALDAALSASGGEGSRSPAEVRAALDKAVANGAGGLHRLMSVATALHLTGRFDEAVEQFDRALAQVTASDPPKEIAKTHAYRGFSKLILGHFQEGWRDYEHRWPAGIIDPPGQVNASVQARLEYDLSLEALTGSRVLVVGEQGIGDQVMFASMLGDLATVAAEVRLFCDRRLRRLFTASFPGIKVVGAEAADQPFDHLIVIGSLARLFRNRLEDFPGTPYLRPSAGAQRRWAERLGPAGARKRVGVSWKGGVARTGASARSMPLSMLEPILSNPDYEIVSLQYGDNAEEVAAVNATLQRPVRLFDRDEIGDFDDLAGLVANLDIVVSVQTSLVHLCGGLGAPALVMVPRVAEWRYGAEGSSIPWYRSVRLFRQEDDRSWPAVVERVALEAARRLHGP